VCAAIGALVADVFAFIFAFYSHVLIDPWTFSTFLAQLIIAVVCGSVIGGGVSYGFLDKEISMPKLE
jgi:formate/nitrite transporter FocA (FNT family)